MPRLIRMWWLSVMTIAVLSGCAENAMVLKGRVAQIEQQQQTLARQNQQYAQRIKTLDDENQNLQKIVSQIRQESQLLEERLAGTKEQLRSATQQLAQTQAEKQDLDQKAKAQMASMQRQSGVPFTPNNSMLQTLPQLRFPNVVVRKDGDVIRVELPGNQLFDQGSARLRPGAGSLVADVAAEIRRTYPDQLLGIEGHTDSDPVVGGQFRTNHELSVQRAMAVHDVLVGSGRYQANQVFVVGHGPNHPVVSNATPEGKQRNRRVELVIYPERRGG